MKKTITTTPSYGDIQDLLYSVERAIQEGATGYNCHIQYTGKANAYVQMIELTKTLSNKEILEIERDKILESLEKINSKLNL
jgi:hypothetical protein